MVFTPADLAKIIGISPGPSGGHTNKLPSPEQVERMLETEMLEFDNRFYTELAAQYMPSLLRTFVQTPWDLTGQYYYLFLVQFSSTTPSRSFSRFARENPDEVAASLLVQLQRLAHLVKLPRTHVNIETIAFSLSTFALSSDSYLFAQHYGDPSAPLLKVSVPLLSELRRSRYRFKALQAEIVGAFDVAVRTAKVATVGINKLERLLDSGCLEATQDELEGFFGLSDKGWWRCGTLSEDGSRCVKGEMQLMCGKCRAVRFCGRDHQRLQWKVHKQYCFEPSW